MKKRTLREARQSLSHLERLLEIEGEMTVTRRGEPIARLIPINYKRLIPSHQEFREKMPRMRRRSEKVIRKDRDAR